MGRKHRRIPRVMPSITILCRALGHSLDSNIPQPDLHIEDPKTNTRHTETSYMLAALHSTPEVSTTTISEGIHRGSEK